MLSVKNLAAAAAVTVLGGSALFAVPAAAEPPSAAPAAAAVSPPSTIDPAKQADIQRLLNVTGVANLGLQAADQMIQNLKGAMPTVSDKTWTEFRKEVNADALVALMVPIYDKHLSHAEIRDLIRFYESPLGKKMTSVMPAITAESMQAGQKWGTEIAQRANQKFNPQAAQKK